MMCIAFIFDGHIVCVFKRMLEWSIQAWNSDQYKIIDGTHVKVHQDACYFLSTPQK